jgi:hypothetical protein
MRRVIALGSALGVVVLGSACATTAGSGLSSRYNTASTQQLGRTEEASARDSVVAQALADREGPRVSIHAEVAYAADSRRVRGVFRLEDDAYVVVGHIDADGVLRIAFPSDPADDGFVRGNQSYSTNEFFAGFNSDYRVRAQNTLFQRTSAASDAYDGRLGYVFIIASWRPMRVDRFQTSGTWDSFEITDDSYLRDPRPAIDELAALLAGDNREAYTVKFARFTNTQGTYAGYGSQALAYNAGYCTGYEPFGFASSPFGYGSSAYASAYATYGYNFAYRGTNYFYDAGGDCYRTAFPQIFGFGYRIAALPLVTTPASPRPFDVTGHRSPPTPQPPPGHVFPKVAPTAPGNAPVAQPSPEYRQRGLITDNGGSAGPIARKPRVEAPESGGDPTRPNIQQMVNRRRETGNGGNDGNNGFARASQGQSQEAPRAHAGQDNGGGAQGHSRPAPVDGARSDPSPRTQAPQRPASPPPPPPANPPTSGSSSSGSSSSSPPVKPPR